MNRSDNITLWANDYIPKSSISFVASMQYSSFDFSCVGPYTVAAFKVSQLVLPAASNDATSSLTLALEVQLGNVSSPQISSMFKDALSF